MKVFFSPIRVRHSWKYLIRGFLVVLLVIVAIVTLNTNHLLATNTKSQLNAMKSNINLHHNITEDIPTLQTATVVQEKKEAPTIFAITYTKRRLTQLLDLTSLCQTLMNVENLLWIVVESTFKKTVLVSDVLDSCKVKSVHLLSSMYNTLTNATNTLQSTNNILRRGAKEKNMGLEWLKRRCPHPSICNGLVYFLDDGSKYDLRLFDQIRNIQYVGVWPVAFAGNIKFQGPVCLNGSIVEWHTLYATTVPFPISSLGFAFNLSCILNNPKALFGFRPQSHIKSSTGWEESDFLSNFLANTSDPRLECRGSYKEAYVWQVISMINPRLRKHKEHWKYKLRT